MISITKEPRQKPGYNPSHNCIEWCINTDELFTTPLAKASCSIAIVPGAVTSGYIEFQNNSFNAGGSVPYTMTTFQVDATNTLNTANNIVGAFNCVPEIYENWNIDIFQIGTTTLILLESKACGYVAPGDFTSGGLIPSGIITFSFVQGTGVKRDNYNLAWQLIMIEPSGNQVILQQIQVLKPSANIFTDCSVKDICIDLKEVIKPNLYTTFMGANANFTNFDEHSLRKFVLKYGYIENLGCDNTTIFFKNSDEIFAINQLIQPKNLNGVLPYIFDGTGPAKYFNLRPNLPLCNNSFMWLYAYLNFPDYFIGTPSAYVRYTLLDSDLNIINDLDQPIPQSTLTYYQEAGVLIIPAGPANMPIWDDDTCLVYIEMYVPQPGGEVQILEKYKYSVADCRSCNFEFYFLSSAGAYETINFSKIVEVTSAISQNEYCFDNYCRDLGIDNSTEAMGNYLQYIYNNGDDQYGSIVNRKFKVTSNKMANSEEIRLFFEEFLASENRFYRIGEYSGARPLLWVNSPKIVIEHSDKIIAKEGRVIYEFTFRFSEGNKSINHD